MEETPALQLTKKPSISVTPSQLKSTKSPRTTILTTIIPPSQTLTTSHKGIISTYPSHTSTPQYHKQNIQEFKQYSTNIDNMIQKVNVNQLEELKNKYRYYLNKVEKLEACYQGLREKEGRLEEIVENSPTIRDQIGSINFILMISKDTENKLVKVIERVNHAKQSKKKYKKQIQQLLNIIKKQKDQYFALKRKEMSIKNKQENELNTIKRQFANDTFKNIINEKIHKKKELVETLKDFHITSNTINTNSQGFRKNYQAATTNGYGKDKDKDISRFSSFQILKKDQGKYQLPQLVKNSSNLRVNIEEKIQPRQVQFMSGIENQCSQIVQQRQKNTQIQSKNENQVHQIDGSMKKLKKSSQMVTQLHKIHLMKQELIKQTQKITPNFQLTQLKSTRKQHTHKYSPTGLANSKQCPACEHKTQKQRVWNQKYSLHAQNENQTNSDHKNKDEECSYANLLMGNKTLQDIEDMNKKREEFLKLPAEEIVKKIMESGKIQEIMKLMEKEKVYVVKNKIQLMLLR